MLISHCKIFRDIFREQGSNLVEVQQNGMAGNCHSLCEAKMKHLVGEPRQSTCLTTDECRGWPDSRPQKVNISNKLSRTNLP
jgi:hypothetical protein